MLELLIPAIVLVFVYCVNVFHGLNLHWVALVGFEVLVVLARGLELLAATCVALDALFHWSHCG